MTNINPAMIKQLLSLQLTQRIGPFPSDTSASGTMDAAYPDSDFGDLLGLLLGGSDVPAAASKVIPASELLARGNYAWSYPIPPSGAATAESATPAAFDGLIAQSAARHGVDSNLIRAVIRAESSFDAEAVSGSGAKGLMQLMDSTGAGLGVTDAFDPQQNIEGGTKFLSGLLKKYNGHEAVALAAYNAGPNRVDRLGIQTDQDLQAKAYLLPKETRNYVDKVLNYKQGYEIE